jgi:hypothetical protein
MAEELMPIVAFAVCAPPAIAPVPFVRFATVATLFINPTATLERLVALEKLDRPMATEFVEPAVQVLYCPTAAE